MTEASEAYLYEAQPNMGIIQRKVIIQLNMSGLEM